MRGRARLVFPTKLGSLSAHRERPVWLMLKSQGFHAREIGLDAHAYRYLPPEDGQQPLTRTARRY
jgi:hypothetical protein